MSFPFLTHRTIREVDETAELLDLQRRARLPYGKWRRLDALITKALLNNPPAKPEPGSAA